MSNIEQIDFSTLTWVKTELDETLNRAKEALKSYVEDSEDINQLQFCVTYLHQIQGTLKMVELYGAAMVAEEMEAVAKDLIDGKIDDTESAYDVLMQSILQLPDYLERIELGHKDVPIVLLPLVNDLRAVRSQKLLSESALFNPNLELGVPDRVAKSDLTLRGNQLKTALMKIRSVYQVALLNWIKQNDGAKALSNMSLVVSKLQMILAPVHLKQLMWTYSAVLEGLQSDVIEDGVAVKQLAGKVDHLIKAMIDGQDHIKSQTGALTRNLLYYIAICDNGGRLVEEVKEFFDLTQFIPDESEVKHAEGSLSGKNKELLQTVSEAINDDVLVVQESLDLFIRNKSAQVEELEPLQENLQKIADTLGILGLGVGRDSVLVHQSELKQAVADEKRPSDENLLDVAKTLLMIESQLGDHIQSLGVSDETETTETGSIPRSEQREIVKQLAKESIVNLQQVKTNFVAFIESPWDKKQVEDNPKLLKEIAGALKILHLETASDHMDDIIAYVNTEILGGSSKPSAMQLEQLATVISSLEYYLENLDQGQRIRDTLLSEVKKQMVNLNAQVVRDSELQTLEDGVTESEEAVEEIAEEATQSGDADEGGQTESDAEQDAKVDVEPMTLMSSSGLTVAFGEDVDEEIKEVFAEEFEEELGNMQSKFKTWQADPVESTDELTEIRRIFHTLKGSGRLVGAEAVGEFGWQMENMCNRLLDGGIENDANFKQIMSEGVDMAGGLFEALQNQTVVPVAYDWLLENAERVASGEQPTDKPDFEALLAAQAQEKEVEEEIPDEESMTLFEELETVDAEESAEASDAEEEDTKSEQDQEDLTLEFDLDDFEEDLEGTDTVAEEAADESDESTSPDEDELDLIEFELDAEDLPEAMQKPAEEDATEDSAVEVEVEGTADAEEDLAIVDQVDLGADLAELDDLDLEAELAELDVSGDSDAEAEAEEVSDEDGLDLDLDDDLPFDLDEGLDLELPDEETAETDDSLDLAEESEAPAEETTAADDGLEVDPVFIEILQKEVGGHLSEMSQFVSDAMEKDTPHVNDDFVRVVHTLNGAASMAAVDGITNMTTPLEKLSIMMIGKNEALNATDMEFIEQVIHHAKSQLNLLGTGEVPVDDSIGQYFISRMGDLSASQETVKDAEDLVVDSTDDIDADDLEAELALLDEPSEETEGSSTDSDSEEVFDLGLDEFDLEAEEAEAEETEAEEAEAEEAEAEEAEAEEAEAEEAEAEEAEAEEAEAEEAEEAPSPVMPIAPVEAEEAEEPAHAETKASELDLDDELLEIFSEEAGEIFDRTDHLLAELDEKPDNPGVIQALQRDLHTLKGGARMAGLNQIGDLSHQLESLFESIAEKNLEVSPAQHEMMSQVMHKLHNMVTADDYGQMTSIEAETEQLKNMLSSEGAEIKEKSKLDEEFFDPLAQVDSPLVEDTTQSEEKAATAAPKKKANVLAGGQIKVNSELLDKLVNFAGEVSIYRSRMEQQAAELRLNIDELENTVDRVRRQLRELEHETEAQIISNYQMEGDELEEDFDPLELDQFSTIQQLSRSLSESVSDLTNIQSYLQESARSSETLLIQQSRVNTELQEGLMETRLVTFNSLVPRLRRVLRTASQELDKKAKLVVKGAEGEMDKTVLEGIQAPLEHMIRNAMVHGLEKNRKKVKKPEQGQIMIELSREATEVVITVKDDGAGINTEVLKAKAIERGIIEADTEINEQEIVQLITHSGLSAADKVTKLAGRGVGMDVVNNEIKRLGGGIEIISEQGVGTTFVIRLPYTLALTQAIVVQVADHRYAIPASGVQGLIRMNINEFRRRVLEGDVEYDYAGETYQIQELNKLLGVDSEALVEGNQVPLVMIKSGEQGVALRVDQTYGGREIVVKSVGTQVASVPGIFGATILGDGAVVLILDIIPMHRDYQQKIERMQEEGVEVVDVQEEDYVTTIMVVDDSITMRRAGERMLARNDFEVLTAKDGLDALNKLQEQKPDLMLLDIEMPRMDGFELATNMKQSEKFKDIPIIMITSRTGQKHKDRAKEIGVERYLGKPYQEIELLDNIKDLLQLEDA